MSESEAEPDVVVRRAGDEEYEAVGAADGMSRAVLVGPDEDAPHFAMRRFVLEAGGSAPKHTNEVEHEQYVLEGEYIVGIGDEEYAVSAGDSLLIPAGVVHWYRNESEEDGAFICVVPNGEDAMQLRE